MDKEQLRKFLGANIKRQRLMRKLSLDEFAELLSITPGFIGLVERGQRGVTSHNLLKIAEIFGISIDSLFYGVDGINGDNIFVKETQKQHEKISCLTTGFTIDELNLVVNFIKGLRHMKDKNK